MSQINIVFPHQLFVHSALLEQPGDLHLIEEYLYFKQYNFHKQKLRYHRASMQFYKDYLIQSNRTVHYINSAEKHSDIRNCIAWASQNGVQSVHVIDAEDDWLMRRLRHACKKYGMQLTVHSSPQFLNTVEEVVAYFSPEKKKYFQTDFYKKERQRRGILIDAAGNPAGNQWTFDTENRKKYPANKPVNRVTFPKGNPYLEEATRYVEQQFPDNIGTLNTDFNYPIGFEESRAWLQQFLQQRMREFGEYEDAIVRKEIVLNHSVLTPMLNSGILTPQEVLDAVFAQHEKHPIPLNSLEGFVRQIIGWREFIRGVYHVKGRQERTSNFWKFEREIPASFYDGTTGIAPLDDTIKKALQTGYCHHIERLMIAGNFMVLCEIHPNAVYRWFMELFIDAYDWVMVPNVYGMSQFADGGIFATKPYISGSNYIMKMSDYPKGEWQQIWDALFWRFMDKHRDFFLKNPRLGMLVKTFDKWDIEKKQNAHRIAETFLSTLK